MRVTLKLYEGLRSGNLQKRLGLTYLEIGYSQHVSDIKAIATWLASTVQRHDCSQPFLAGNSGTYQNALVSDSNVSVTPRDVVKPIPPGLRSQSIGSFTGHCPENPMQIDDFVTLAERLTKSKQTDIAFPPKLYSVVERALRVKTNHYCWWHQRHAQHDSSCSESQESQQNQNLVRALGQVQRILESKATDTAINLNNIYTTEGLKIKDQRRYPPFIDLLEDTGLEYALTIDRYSPRPTETIQNESGILPTDHTVDLEANLEDASLALHYLFNELAAIRFQIREIWEAFGRGAVRLESAAVTTDFAIELVRQLETDFIQRFPNHADFEIHFYKLYRQLCSALGQDPDHRDNSNDELNFAVYEAADSVLFSTYTILSSLRNAIRIDTQSSSKPTVSNTDDQASEYASKSPRDKLRADRNILLDIIPDLCLLAQHPDILPVEDEMVRVVRDMLDQTNISLWHVFATQLYLDVHHILSSSCHFVNGGYSELSNNTSHYIKENIEKLLRFHKHLKCDQWKKVNDEALYQVLDQIESYVETDAIAAKRKAMAANLDYPSQPKEPFLLLNNHPWCCGLILFSVKTLTKQVSIDFVNAWGAVLATAHLYNAARQEKLVLWEDWGDMDLVLSMHRLNAMFDKKPPITAQDYLAHFCLSIQLPAEAAVKSEQMQTKFIPPHSCLRLDDLAPVSKMFIPRHRRRANHVNLSEEDAETIIKLHAAHNHNTHELRDCHDSCWYPAKIRIPADPKQSTPQVQPSAAISQEHKENSFSPFSVRPDQLLSSIFNTLEAETIELMFDHLGFHMFCMRLLRHVKRAVNTDLQDIYGPAYLKDRSELPLVVGYIFDSAVQAPVVTGGKLLPKRKDVVTGQPLIKATHVLQTMLENDYGKEQIQNLWHSQGLCFPKEDTVDALVPHGEHWHRSKRTWE